MAAMSGAILRVDLTRGIHWSEDLVPAVRRQFVDARGVNAWLFWREAKGGIDPLGPEKPLIFGAELLTGANVPCSGRTTVTTKSPVTNLGLKTHMGGGWGAALRAQ